MKRNPLLIVVLIIVVHMSIKMWMTADTIGPLVYSDELEYKINAASIFNNRPLDTDHYPPLYSLVLSPAFFSEDNWYAWMLIINVIFSSAAGLAVYLISRRFLPTPAAFGVLALFLLWPFHIVYPRLLMSENLHVSLFLFSVLFALGPEGKGIKKRIGYNAAFAACMALGYMTKHLFLAAIPVLVFLWAVRPFFEPGGSIRAVFGKSRAVQLVLIGIAFLLLYSLWLVYARSSQFSLIEALGGSVVAHPLGGFADFENLVNWIGIYTAYSVFSFGPYALPLALCLIMAASGKLHISRYELFLGIAVCLLSGAFFTAAVQHSWRAVYNYPVPHRVLGRYLIHLWPLFILVSIAGMRRVMNSLDRVSPPLVALSVSMCLAGLWAAGWMLFGHPGWQLKFGFINSPDAALYQFRIFSVAVSAGVVLMGLLIGCSRYSRRIARWSMPLVLFFFVGVQLVSCFGAYQFSVIRGLEAIHGRVLADVLEKDLEKGYKPVVVVYDFPETSKYFSHSFTLSLKFWLSLPENDTSVQVLPLSEFVLDHQPASGKRYFLKTEDLGGAVFQYQGAERPFSGLGILGDWAFKRYPLLRRAQERQTYFLYAADVPGLLTKLVNYSTTSKF